MLTEMIAHDMSGIQVCRFLISVATSENTPLYMYIQQRFRSVFTFIQSDQNLHWVNFPIVKVAKFLHVHKKDSNKTV